MTLQGREPSAYEAVQVVLDRIEQVDPLVNAVCTLNPAALEQAERLDAERAEGRIRSALHGQPVLVKDNIDTADLLTTAGSLALAETPPAEDAPLVQRLRGAGMVIVGKSNLSEWANIRDSHSTSGWSAFGGLTRNPYALNRSAGGSSSGSGAAVAAGIVRYAIGTETDGSITCPAAYNGTVGIKPTVGSIPGAGIVPISPSQDTAGPLAPTVREAADLLTILTGGAIDYGSHAQARSLSGTRIGVPRAGFWGEHAPTDDAAEHAIELLAAAGAEIVDATDLESMAGYGFDDELLVLLSELRAALGSFLPGRGPDGPQSLADVVEFNVAHADLELGWFGQDLFEQALEGPELGSREYLAARSACLAHGRDDGIDKVLREHRLDALVTPSYTPAGAIDTVCRESFWGPCTQPAAMAGYPLLTVPSGTVHDLPVAVTFWGTAASEPRLIEIAATYESARDGDEGPLPAPTFPTFV